MKEMLKAVPVLSRLLHVQPDLVRAHTRNKVGDIGKYCFVAPSANGSKVRQYFVMKADLPKILHRELTPEELEEIGG